jgi:hypothetical protein
VLRIPTAVIEGPEDSHVQFSASLSPSLRDKRPQGLERLQRYGLDETSHLQSEKKSLLPLLLPFRINPSWWYHCVERQALWRFIPYANRRAFGPTPSASGYFCAICISYDLFSAPTAPIRPDGNSTTRQRRSQASIVPLTASTASLAPA